VGWATRHAIDAGTGTGRSSGSSRSGTSSGATAAQARRNTTAAIEARLLRLHVGFMTGLARLAQR